MTVAGIFCADYHSLYKPYFYRQVNSFKSIAPVVCTWSKGERKNSEAVIESMGCEWGLDRYPRVLRRLCARVGWPLAGGTLDEHMATASYIDAHAMDIVLAHTGFVADRIFESVMEKDIPLVLYLHGGDLREATHSRGWRKRMRTMCRGA